MQALSPGVHAGTAPTNRSIRNAPNAIPKSHAKERAMSYVNQVTAVIGKFNESTHHDPALAEVLTQILEALKEIEQRFEALEASAME
jgi:hypothetical protein